MDDVGRWKGQHGDGLPIVAGVDLNALSKLNHWYANMLNVHEQDLSVLRSSVQTT